MKDSNAVFARVVGEDSSFQNRNYLVSGAIPFDCFPRIVSGRIDQFGPFDSFVLAIAIILGQTDCPALHKATPGFSAFREPLADVRTLRFGPPKPNPGHALDHQGDARQAAGLTDAHVPLHQVYAALVLRDPPADIIVVDAFHFLGVIPTRTRAARGNPPTTCPFPVAIPVFHTSASAYDHALRGFIRIMGQKPVAFPLLVTSRAVSWSFALWSSMFQRRVRIRRKQASC